jgi:hypothetical protein
VVNDCRANRHCRAASPVTASGSLGATSRTHGGGARGAWT